MNRVRVVITIYKMHTYVQIHAQCGKIKRLLLFTWKIFGEKVVILYEWPDYKKRALVKCNDDRLYLAENISWNQYSLLKQLFVKRFFYEIFTASFLSNQKTFIKTFADAHVAASKMISGNLLQVTWWEGNFEWSDWFP